MAVDGQRFMTKTQHYRKVTKPLLERKRRARMNLYLDELKDLIVDTMEAEGEHVAKLEKADILELTVNYLKLHKQEIAAANEGRQRGSCDPPGALNVEKFRAGYTQAAYEVSKIFATLPGVDLQFGTRLMQHLGYQLKDMKKPGPTAVASGGASVAGDHPNDSTNHESLAMDMQMDMDMDMDGPNAKGEDVWRPW